MKNFTKLNYRCKLKSNSVRPILILFILVFLYQGKVNGQSFSLGGGLKLSVPNNNLSIGLGLNLQGEYRFRDNYSLRMNSAFTVSQFNKARYMGGDQYTLAGFEGEFLYYPKSGSFQYYGGLGLGYYIPHTDRAGMPHYITGNAQQDLWVFGNHLDNSFGYNVLAGLKFSADRPISFNLELKYIFLDSKLTTHVSGWDGSRYIDEYRKGIINLNAFTTSFSIHFRL